MRLDRLRLKAIAAWLGVIALGFNALVPIHLAFSLAIDSSRSAECGRHIEAEDAGRGASWHLLALLTGHLAGSSHGDPRHGAHLPAQSAVCGAIATLAGFVPAASAILPLPIRLEQALSPRPPAETRPQQTPLFRYRSRAPPEQAVSAS
jgi:hypothetical protein